ncbi:hypothetical protein J2S55_008402 [Streptosporangium brasiliense]|uniref:Uncharacterized protein n=1 Tax=Streptosporangium brasiliense TaxID=47480 RepID=A0ABT9RJY7_9ACTN|nr:hypothetical protein [Streptosporangium brasiliense]
MFPTVTGLLAASSTGLGLLTPLSAAPEWCPTVSATVPRP